MQDSHSMAAIKLFKFLSTLEPTSKDILWAVISEFCSVSNALIHHQICDLLVTFRFSNISVKDDSKFLQNTMALVNQSTTVR